MRMAVMRTVLIAAALVADLRTRAKAERLWAPHLPPEAGGTGRGFLAYGTAKGALAQYTRLAAADLSPRIRVNAIAVGSVATSALEVVVGNDEIRGKMESATPLRKIGEAEDIAATVIYLASQAGAYLTGKVLEVDGGLQAPNLELGLPDL